MDVGSVIGGVAQGVGTVIAGGMQNKANKEMNADNLRLAYIQRGDQLKQTGFENRMAMQDREARDRDSAYQRLQDKRAAIRQRLSDDMGYRNNIISMVNATRRR